MERGNEAKENIMLPLDTLLVFASLIEISTGGSNRNLKYFLPLPLSLGAVFCLILALSYIPLSHM